MDAEDLVKYDVIITTYQVVAGEHLNVMTSQGNKRKKMVQNLFAVKWKVSLVNPIQLLCLI